MRDFPTPEFGNAVVNKNFQLATGNEAECEEKEIAKDIAEQIARLEEDKKRQEELKQQAEKGIFNLNTDKSA